MCTPAGILLGLIAVLFPPLPVWINRGLCSADSIINILLCCLGYLPGLLHAWYIIASTHEEYYHPEDIERGDVPPGTTVTYYYVQEGHSQPQQRAYGTVPQQQPQQQGEASTGDVPPPYSEAVKGDNKIQSPVSGP